MLVLTRNCGEGIVIKHEGETLSLRVTGGNGKRIKMMIDGPRSFDVQRTKGEKKSQPDVGSELLGSKVYARTQGSQWVEAIVHSITVNNGVPHFDVRDYSGTIHKSLLAEDFHQIKGEHADE